MVDEIKPNSVYTPEEARNFLKISESTMKRMIKNGIIKAFKVSGQYRIWGVEILKLASPGFRYPIYGFYMRLKNRIIKVIKFW